MVSKISWARFEMRRREICGGQPQEEHEHNGHAAGLTSSIKASSARDREKLPHLLKRAPFWAMTAPSAGTRSPLSTWDGRTSLFT